MARINKMHVNKMQSSGPNSTNVANVGRDFNQFNGSIPEHLPYARLKNNDAEMLMEHIAHLTNTILKIESQNIPFVFPSQIPDEWNNNTSNNYSKSLILGAEGAGKSRLIYEYIRSRIDLYDEVWILNPSGKIDGVDFGEISVYDLVTKLITPRSLIIWTDFPDPLLSGENVESGLSILQQISSARVKNILIEVKSIYSTLYSNIETKLMNLKPIFVEYSLDDIKLLIKEYGSNISDYQPVYQSLISKLIDNIADLLYNKHAVPATIKFYYEQLIEDQSLYPLPLEIASKLPSLTDHYSSALNIISDEKPELLHFLFVLKLCYELRINRTIPKLRSLQKQVFGTETPTNIQILKRWVEYRSNEFSFRYNNIKNIIDFGINTYRIMEFLSSKDFLEEMPEDYYTHFFFGTFYGKNLQYIDIDESPLFKTTWDYLAHQLGFKTGLASGLAYLFYSLDASLQLRVLDLVRKEIGIEYAFYLYWSPNFNLLDKSVLDILLAKSRENTIIASILGVKFGLNLESLDQRIVDESFNSAGEIPFFYNGFLTGLARVFPRLSKNLQNELWTKIQENETSILVFGLGIGQWSPFFREDVDQLIDEKILDNEIFYGGMIIGGASMLAYYDKEDQEFLIENVKNFGFESEDFNSKEIGNLLVTFGPYIRFLGVNFVNVEDEIKVKILDMVPALGPLIRPMGAGIVAGFVISPQRRKDISEILTIAETNPSLKNALAYGFGHTYSLFDDNVKQQIMEFLKSNNLIESYLSGVAEMSILNNSIDPSILTEIKSDDNIAYTTGLSLVSSIFNSYSKELKEQLSLIATENKSFAKGLGDGFRYLLDYIVISDQKFVKEFINSNDNIQRAFNSTE